VIHANRISATQGAIETARYAGTYLKAQVPDAPELGMTVASCLQLTPLDRGQVLCGRRGLDRGVRWVHVVDHSDPEDSLAEGELLLTSGIALSQDSALRADIFDIMQRQNSAALVISLGRYMPEVPPEMLQAGEACGIPVIGLPWEVNFGDITRAVLAPLLYTHYQSLERSEELGRKLLDLVLHGAGLSDLCERIAATLACPVAIFGAEGCLRGASTRGQTLGGEWRTQVATALAAGPDHAHSGLRHLVMGGRSLGIALPLATHRKDWMVLAGLPAPLPRWEQLIAGSAAAAAALLLTREEAAAAMAQRPVAGRLLELLESGSPMTAALALELGLQPAQPCCVLIAEPRDEAGAEALQTVASLLARQFGIRLMARQQGMAIYVLQRPTGRTKQWADRLAAALAESGGACRLAIARADLPVAEVAEGYAQAREALRLGRVLRPKTDVLHAEQVVVLARMARNLNRDAPPHEVSPAISKLAEQDRSLHGSLIETLECVLNAEGNVSLAARQLGVHRHTLLYRIGRICDILGIEFDSVSRLELRLQLMAWRLAGA
jgi:purine catabolism regulator